MRVPLWAVTTLIVSTCPSVLARAQLTDVPERAAILNGLAPDHTGRVGGASIDGRGIEIAPSDVDVTRGPHESQVAGPAAAALAPRPAGSIDAQELASEIAGRFGSLEGCRTDVAPPEAGADARHRGRSTHAPVDHHGQRTGHLR